MIDLLKKSSFFLLIGVLVIFIFIFTREQDVPEHPELSSNVLSTNANQDPSFDILSDQTKLEQLFVDIKGAVVKPGVYKMKTGDRVNDVIQIAGGFTDDADQTSVNLAQKVHDEMIIIVPYSLSVDGGGELTPTSNDNSEGGKIRINYATQEEIETLTGIGPSKAQAIIQYREENGYFQTPEDLLEISGIGEKTLENFKDDIQIP